MSAMFQPHGHVHFCGEQTAVGSRGMEGAMESGERAALEDYSYYLATSGAPMTFDAGPPEASSPPLRLDGHAQVSVCDLTGAERFLVWAVRWAASLHDDESFAAMCLRDSFERAGLGTVLPVFRRYVSLVHGAPSPCPPSARLGCWRINSVEAQTLHALGENADMLAAQGARIRSWDVAAA